MFPNLSKSSYGTNFKFIHKYLSSKYSKDARKETKIKLS